jgi:hypothetical protein
MRNSIFIQYAGNWRLTVPVQNKPLFILSIHTLRVYATEVQLPGCPKNKRYEEERERKRCGPCGPASNEQIAHLATTGLPLEGAGVQKYLEMWIAGGADSRCIALHCRLLQSASVKYCSGRLERSSSGHGFLPIPTSYQTTELLNMNRAQELSLSSVSPAKFSLQERESLDHIARQYRGWIKLLVVLRLLWYEGQRPDTPLI